MARVTPPRVRESVLVVVAEVALARAHRRRSHRNLGSSLDELSRGDVRCRGAREAPDIDVPAAATLVVDEVVVVGIQTGAPTLVAMETAAVRTGIGPKEVRRACIVVAAVRAVDDPRLDPVVHRGAIDNQLSLSAKSVERFGTVRELDRSVVIS